MSVTVNNHSNCIFVDLNPSKMDEPNRVIIEINENLRVDITPTSIAIVKDTLKTFINIPFKDKGIIIVGNETKLSPTSSDRIFILSETAPREI